MTDHLQQIIHSLSETTKATITRSDVLRVLIWPIVPLMMLVLWLANRPPPNPLLIVFGALLCLFLVVYLATFVFLLFRDRDALRSERYVLQKLAIEHGYFGDNRTGISAPTATTTALTNVTPAAEGGDAQSGAPR